MVPSTIALAAPGEGPPVLVGGATRIQEVLRYNDG